MVCGCSANSGSLYGLFSNPEWGTIVPEVDNEEGEDKTDRIRFRNILTVKHTLGSDCFYFYFKIFPRREKLRLAHALFN